MAYAGYARRDCVCDVTCSWGPPNYARCHSVHLIYLYEQVTSFGRVFFLPRLVCPVLSYIVLPCIAMSSFVICSICHAFVLASPVFSCLLSVGLVLFVPFFFTLCRLVLPCLVLYFLFYSRLHALFYVTVTGLVFVAFPPFFLVFSCIEFVFSCVAFPFIDCPMLSCHCCVLTTTHPSPSPTTSILWAAAVVNFKTSPTDS